MRHGPTLAAALGAAIFLGAQPTLDRKAYISPSLSLLPDTPYALQDTAMASIGLRALAADLAWIQLLQYAAGDVPELPDPPGHPFSRVKELCQRVVRLDPAFHRAYLFGAGILAWFHGVDRPDDALDLLQEGMKRDPGQPLYSEYIAALAFKKRGDTSRMIAILEATLKDPQSPIETKAILANLYKGRREYARALAIWDAILDDPDEAREWPRARIQVAEIKRLIQERR